MLFRRSGWRNDVSNRAQYIACVNGQSDIIDLSRFYNGMWLVANDVIIGIALGSFLMENCETVGTFIHDNLEVNMILLEPINSGSTIRST